ncbi:predicted protein [Coccidioides posadasii str. Silveira]|uniref:Predicted protein n=1 Tax=Coccidioides posadasii (strain RMSCC 757 / Silveira) TaxID=443226 RepID=E9D3W5_COCPS|nr:predicted protein [Coccidioides posadasii str. Silveira]
MNGAWRNAHNYWGPIVRFMILILVIPCNSVLGQSPPHRRGFRGCNIRHAAATCGVGQLSNELLYPGESSVHILGFSFTRHPQPQQQSFERLTGIFSISDALAGKPCVASLLACRIQSSIKYFWVRHLLPEIPSFKVIRLSTETSFTLGSKSMRDDADCSQTAG